MVPSFQGSQHAHGMQPPYMSQMMPTTQYHHPPPHPHHLPFPTPIMQYPFMPDAQKELQQRWANFQKHVQEQEKRKREEVGVGEIRPQTPQNSSPSPPPTNNQEPSKFAAATPPDSKFSASPRDDDNPVMDRVYAEFEHFWQLSSDTQWGIHDIRAEMQEPPTDRVDQSLGLIVEKMEQAEVDQTLMMSLLDEIAKEMSREAPVNSDAEELAKMQAKLKERRKQINKMAESLFALGTRRRELKERLRDLQANTSAVSTYCGNCDHLGALQTLQAQVADLEHKLALQRQCGDLSLTLQRSLEAANARIGQLVTERDMAHSTIQSLVAEVEGYKAEAQRLSPDASPSQNTVHTQLSHWQVLAAGLAVLVLLLALIAFPNF